MWQAWTDKQILDKWWAPKPWTSETKNMELVEGGKRIYSMTGSNGEKQCSMEEFTAIKPNENLKFKDCFCENEQVKDSPMPQSEWDVKFQDEGQFSKVNITIQHQNPEDLDKDMEMGFKEGFEMCFQDLDEVLENKKKEPRKALFLYYKLKYKS